jgi:hypothetical protein
MAGNNNEICSQEEFEEKIRPDLKDISNTIFHLLQLSDYFRQKSCKWVRWWNNDVAEYIYRKGDGDKELIEAAEWAYRAGVGLAQTLSDVLPKINSIKHHPRLKDYVCEIRQIQGYWIPKDEKLLSRCEQIISARKSSGTDFGDIELMLRWHKEHLKILRKLDTDLAIIEGSERYKIENVGKAALKQPQEQPTTKKKRWGKDKLNAAVEQKLKNNRNLASSELARILETIPASIRQTTAWKENRQQLKKKKNK